MEYVQHGVPVGGGPCGEHVAPVAPGGSARAAPAVSSRRRQSDRSGCGNGWAPDPPGVPLASLSKRCAGHEVPQPHPHPHPSFTSVLSTPTPWVYLSPRFRRERISPAAQGARWPACSSPRVCVYRSHVSLFRVYRALTQIYGTGWKDDGLGAGPGPQSNLCSLELGLLGVRRTPRVGAGLPGRRPAVVRRPQGRFEGQIWTFGLAAVG
jgi:hypothetical protein